jgi:hypothetical protein
MSIPPSAWFATTPAPETSQWLLPAPLFRLLVLGGLGGLVLATVVIVAIWLVEWRRGQVW